MELGSDLQRKTLKATPPEFYQLTRFRKTNCRRDESAYGRDLLYSILSVERCMLILAPRE